MFVCMISRSNSIQSHVGPKTRSLGQILEKPCVHFRGHNFDETWSKRLQIGCLGHVHYRADRNIDEDDRSNLEKPCVHSRSHNFDPILMKLSQNVCLHDIQVKLETGSYWVKNQVTGSNLRKILSSLQRPQFCSNLDETFSECLSPS